MRETCGKRPDGAALRLLLEREQLCCGGAVLRLAWQAGLTRDEIAALRWEQVSFQDERLELPDRTVPLPTEFRTWLWRFYEARGSRSSYVVASERSGGGMQPESISRLARQMLYRGGLSGVQLMDLRYDWMLRQLEEKDWPAVARISGVAVAALQVRFPNVVPCRKKAEPAETVDEFKLWKILQAEKRTAAGMALWLTWQMRLQAGEIAALRWEQVDWAGNRLILSDREVQMTSAVRRLLMDEQERRAPGDDPHVLLTERSRRPLDLPRLSRLVRAALIRGGMEEMRLMDLRRSQNQENSDAALLARAAEAGSVSRGEAMVLLGLSRTAAYSRLRRLAEQGRMVRVGGRYYLAGTVVPPQEQPDAIRAYLEQAEFAYRQDIAALLRVRPQQCSVILRRLVEGGVLIQEGQRYRLCRKEDLRKECI